MSIRCVIYSKFDHTRGPVVVHQVPENSVAVNDLSAHDIENGSGSIVSFSAISKFLIPRQALCGNLICFIPPTLDDNKPPCIVVSHPVCLKGEHYPRNEFIFNLALVLSSSDNIDVTSYKSVVTKIAKLLRGLEEQCRWLSDDTDDSGSGKIYNLCETLMEDLNNYAECMIPIDDINTLNIKLFPTLPEPAPVKAWHVPIFTVRIETVMDENWDLTMQRVIPFINGVNSIKIIASLADADLKLTQECVRHLLYYGCVLLLDIFGFNNIYAPTAEFGSMIVNNIDMQAECAQYVNTAPCENQDEQAISSVNSSASLKSDLRGYEAREGGLWPETSRGEILDGTALVQLYTCLRQGLSVRDWYLQNTNMLANVDLRRFITFGVIKGFLYRVHRYAIQISQTRQSNTPVRSRRPSADILKPVTWFLDGKHCFDEICTYYGISEKDLTRRLKQKELGEVIILCR